MGMDLRLCNPAGRELCKPAQRRLLGGLRAVEELTFQRLEDVGGRKESVIATVANNDASLERHASTRRADFDNVVVKHKSLLRQAYARRSSATKAG